MKGPDEDVFVFIDVVFRIIKTTFRRWLQGQHYYQRLVLNPDSAIEDFKYSIT
jgi:hypothetical protein